MNNDNTMPEFNKLWSGAHVELPAMLESRERRAFRQMELLKTYHKPLLCFTMNIAGPIKNNPLITRGFDLGVAAFHMQMARTKKTILFEEVNHETTGNEAWFVVDADPFLLKKLTCEIEEKDDLGRLYDMDVLYQDGTTGEVKKIDREEVGGSPRRCLICNAPGKDCSSRRLHTVLELQQKSASILYHAVATEEAQQIAQFATKALLYEVSTTPKPGLVDRNNSGSHNDMDFFTFMNSCSAMWPYFEECARIGQTTAEEEATATFQQLRNPGKFAENRMLSATNGVNTHKGAIFSMGVLCAAAGRLSAGSLMGLHSQNKRKDPQAILKECAGMTAGLVESDFAEVTKENAQTVGEKLYSEYGITGIRGQMEAGLPAVATYGLPLLKDLLDRGWSSNDAGAAVLLSIIANTNDTTLINRSSVQRQKEAAEEAKMLLQNISNGDSLKTKLEELDQRYMQENLSPGGSADLLAACWCLYFIEHEAI